MCVFVCILCVCILCVCIRVCVLRAQALHWALLWDGSEQIQPYEMPTRKFPQICWRPGTHKSALSCVHILNLAYCILLCGRLSLSLPPPPRPPPLVRLLARSYSVGKPSRCQPANPSAFSTKFL